MIHWIFDPELNREFNCSQPATLKSMIIFAQIYLITQNWIHFQSYWPMDFCILIRRTIFRSIKDCFQGRHIKFSFSEVLWPHNILLLWWLGPSTSSIVNKLAFLQSNHDFSSVHLPFCSICSDLFDIWFQILRSEFNRDQRLTNRTHLLLSAAISPSPDKIVQSYELPQVAEWVKGGGGCNKSGVIIGWYSTGLYEGCIVRWYTGFLYLDLLSWMTWSFLITICRFKYYAYAQCHLN